MVDQLSSFRKLVTVAAVLTVFSPLVDLVAPSLLSDLGAIPAHPTHDWSAVARFAVWLGFLSYLAALVAAVGLFLLKRWARTLALVASVTALCTYLPFGEVSHSGVGLSVALAAVGFWGAALGLAYFGDPRSCFAK